jgi:hypothetical protein
MTRATADWSDPTCQGGGVPNYIIDGEPGLAQEYIQTTGSLLGLSEVVGPDAKVSQRRQSCLIWTNRVRG